MMDVLLWAWQAPQNIVGLIMWLISRRKGATKESYEGVIKVTCSGIGGAVSLGRYIFSARWCTLRLRHEWGHTRQSRYLGWLYLIVIGLPSIIRAWLNLYKDYYKFYTESWADKLGGITRDSDGNRVYRND